MHQTRTEYAASGDDQGAGLFLQSASGQDWRPSRRTLRILIADDYRDELLTLMALLRDEGYEAQGAQSGEVLLQMAENFPADVYILDIGMPGMSGYDVARALRERYGKAPVLIAITAWQRTPDKLAAEIAGFDHHFGKPFDTRALLELLMAVASRPRQH